MNLPYMGIMLTAVIGLGFAPGCQGEKREPAPPPDAQRPQIKSEAQLAAERDERIAAGKVVPAEPSDIGRVRATPTPAPRPLPPPLIPGPDAIQADLLIVDNETLTAAEVLYPLRAEIAAAVAELPPAALQRRIQRWVQTQVQQDIGAVLIYNEAMSKLSDPQQAVIDQGVEGVIRDRITHEFGGSRARLEAHVAEAGLTFEQFERRLRRDLVVRQYTRERLSPFVHITRADLLAAYQRAIDSYATPERRELLLIEAPFDQFLPDDAAWDSASATARAQARLRAMRHIRKAHEALDERPFADVAREYSRGLRVESGGSWGLIEKPLRPPYDAISQRIFEFQPGQVSDPIETELGWYIVGCGDVVPAHQTPFEDVQEKIADNLREEQFGKLASEYISELTRDATVSGLRPFLESVMNMALAHAEAAAAATDQQNESR